MLTTGEILKKKRQELDLSLEAIERETRIRKEKLAAIEQADWSIFPSKTYIIGVISTYSKTVGLDPQKLIAFFRREYEKEEKIKFKKKISRKYLNPETRKALLASTLLVILVFTLYFGYQVKLYLQPPNVEIISPKKTSFVKEDRITLVGKAPEDSIIEVNGEKIFQEENLTFRKNIPLNAAKNPVTIKVTGANGKITVVKKIYLKK